MIIIQRAIDLEDMNLSPWQDEAEEWIDHYSEDGQDDGYEL